MTTTHSVRPVSHPQRASCRAFADELDPSDPVIRATLVGTFRPADAALLAARTANEAAATRVASTGDAVHRASAAFSAAFDKWTTAVDHVHRRGFAAVELRSELGNQPFSAYLRSAARFRVDRMRSLLVRVEQDLALVGDPAALETLRQATADLADAVSESEAALRARRETVSAQKRAIRAFDHAWGLLVQDLLRYDPGLPVPRFARTRGSEPAPSPAPPDPIPAPEPVVQAPPPVVESEAEPDDLVAELLEVLLRHVRRTRVSPPLPTAGSPLAPSSRDRPRTPDSGW